MRVLCEQCEGNGYLYDPDTRWRRCPRCGGEGKRGLDPRIGLLQRGGEQVFYATLDGQYIERYTLDDMEEVLKARDAAKR